MAYDILIKSGTVLDGSGGAPALADIGVKGDTISAIGDDLGNASADLIIDASGKYVTPGFIDITNHSDTHLTLFKYPALESLTTQGITTIIGGNCGASLAPLGSHEALDAIRKWADPSEINVDWATVEEFLKTLEGFALGVNFGTFAGYGTLRRGVIGDEVRVLTLEEREKIKLLLREAVEQGAFGLSLGLAYGHEKISPTSEIVEIAKVLAPSGGIVKIHLRSEGAEILASVNEAVRIGREAGIPVHISHLKAIGKKSWPQFEKALNLIASARSNGLDITYDVSPYRTTGSPLYLLIPHWAREGGFSLLFKRLADPDTRGKIIQALQNATLHYDKIFIISAKLRTAVGHTLAEIAEESGLPPEEALLETVRASEGRVTIIGRTVSPKNTELAVEEPDSFIGSDGEGYAADHFIETGNLVHPRSFGAFPHFWHRFVNLALSEKSGVNDLKKLAPEAAVKKMTSGPAEKFGLQKRGLLKAGNYADITVFDPRSLKDRSTYRNPFQYPDGMEWVLVNGKIAVEKGKVLGARGGKLLTKT